jgi:hypothetical protein
LKLNGILETRKLIGVQPVGFIKVTKVAEENVSLKKMLMEMTVGKLKRRTRGQTQRHKTQEKN